MKVLTCPCQDEEKLSTTKGLFEKRWYPTYLFSNASFSLILDMGRHPSMIVNVCKGCGSAKHGTAFPAVI